MSAIVGIHYLDGRPVDRNHLERMVEILAHRGPDGKEIWNKGSIGLGHRMLWTTPESLHEKLPLTSRSGDLVITADARIDNRDELITALDLTHRKAEEITDSELILSTYEKWGEQCPEKLIGDFAFAIWDDGRQRLFCARDHMGVKPFYYYHSDRVFVFATEIKALLCLQEVPHQLNEVKVADHLATLFEDKASTFYRGVFRLPPAHSVSINCNGIQLSSYWNFDPTHNIRLASDGEYAEAFREIFTEAVRCRLRSAFPVGSTLSGGLDSSSIACTARNLMAQRGNGSLHTFSAIFPGLPEEDLKKIDERPYMNAVLVKGGFLPHYIHADRLSPLMELDKAMWYSDEAVLAPNLYMHWAMYRVAQDNGVRVFLDGIDGDTTVSHGFEFLMELTRTGRWTELYREAAALGRMTNRSPREAILRFGIKPLVPNSMTKIWRKLRGRNNSTEIVPPIINPVFARRIDLETRINKQNAQIKPIRSARESHLRGLTQGLNTFALQLADSSAASFSLEPRYPFFDRRLMEFCLALPPEQKLHLGWSRIVLRRSMNGILPKRVQWRTGKANLSPNFYRRLLEYEGKTLGEVILKRTDTIDQYVNMQALRSAYHQYIEEPMKRGSDAMCIYGSVTLALWLQTLEMPNYFNYAQRY